MSDSLVRERGSLISNAKGTTVSKVLDQAIALSQKEGMLAAALFLQAQYEEVVSAVKESSGDSASKKEREAAYTEAISDETQQSYEDTMEAIRAIVFETISQDHETAPLFWTGLKDYASDEISLFRDAVLDSYKTDGDDAEDENVPEYDVDELKEMRDKAQTFFSVAQMVGEFDPKKKNSEVSTKKTKGGEIVLGFSNLTGLSNRANSEADSKVSAYVRYSLTDEDGSTVEFPRKTPLSTICLWHLSDANATVTVSDVKARVQKADAKFSDDSWEVALNGRGLKKWRENV